ncbi:hypothetical protein DNK47_02410 [Mycoplasma wenyonii]|uniref:Uncharacterized protein n=1 Tax=Mycoplasma wenyonii TaxID=65123 RepID=A0A328PT84_9MOLU|nr:hypothetical protein [Mycoplasma wenyonii]RAO94940.1 hypothetical protein DNK47_02410 [Mycoplasma wenyonii]
MAFALFPVFAQLIFATAVIGGGGTAFVKSIQGGQSAVSKPTTNLTHQSVTQVTRTLTTESSSLTKQVTQAVPSSVKAEAQVQESPKVVALSVPVKAENCKITKKLGYVPESFQDETKDYVTISCSDNVLNPFPYNWKGLFPNSIFKSGEQFSEGQELIIKIEYAGEELANISEITELDSGSKLTISSPKFTTPIMTAEWNYLEEDSAWAVITVTHPFINQKIYLLLDEEGQKPAGNCEIINNLNYIPESFKGSLDSYFSISCDTSGVDTFPDPLKGLFPKELFKNQDKLTVGKRFDVKIETDMEGTQETEDFGITFAGEKFSSSLSGRWNYEQEGPGAVVKLSGGEKQVYLLLNDSNS